AVWDRKRLFSAEIGRRQCDESIQVEDNQYCDHHGSTDSVRQDPPADSFLGRTHSSIWPFGLVMTADKPVFAACSTETFKPRPCLRLSNSCVDDDRSTNCFRVQPLGASSEGCCESRLHSMKKGSSPPRSSFKLKDFQRSVLPSGRAREPSLGPLMAKPAFATF